MAACDVITGFFVLRRCDAPVVAACVQCGRGLCPAHVADRGLCPECAVAMGYGGDPTTSSSAAALARRRRGFYSEAARAFGDLDWYSSLDEFDRAPFQPGAGAGHGNGPDHGGHGHHGHGDHGYGDGRDLVDS
jgi:hypothetical protein